MQYTNTSPNTKNLVTIHIGLLSTSTRAPEHTHKPRHQKETIFLVSDLYSRFIAVHLGLDCFSWKTSRGILEAIISIIVKLTLKFQMNF